MHLNPSRLWGTIQGSRGGGSSALLLAQLLLKPSEFVHRNNFLLIHNLLNALNFLNLEQ